MPVVGGGRREGSLDLALPTQSWRGAWQIRGALGNGEKSRVEPLPLVEGKTGPQRAEGEGRVQVQQLVTGQKATHSNI